MWCYFSRTPGLLLLVNSTPAFSSACWMASLRLAFAYKFYAAIASGQSLQSAFKQRKVAVEPLQSTKQTRPFSFGLKALIQRKWF